MKSKILKFLIYAFSIIASVLVTIELGAELITQYEIYSTGMSDRSELGDDLGFGILLMLGLIPELIIGCVVGFGIGNRIHDFYYKNT